MLSHNASLPVSKITFFDYNAIQPEINKKIKKHKLTK